MSIFRGLLAVVCVSLVTLLNVKPVHAQDLFRVDVNDGGTEFSVSAGNFPRLIDNFLSGTNEFSSIGVGSNFTSRVRFLGVDNAIQINGTVSASTADYTVVIPSTGFNRNFTGLTQEEAQKEVETFFEEQGAGVLSTFVKEMNSSSPLGIIDGNPRSTTAIMANAAFMEYGLSRGYKRVGLTNPTFKPNKEPERTKENKRPKTPDEWLETSYPGEDGFGVKVTFDAYYSRVQVGGFSDLDATGGRYGLELQFGRHLALNFGLIGQIRFFGGTTIYDGGVQIAAPITILEPDENLPVFWQVTPVFQTAGSVSYEAATGGLFTGGGINSVAEYYHGPFQFLMANQFTYYEGLDASVSGIDVETDLQQLIIKNGFKITWNIFEFMSADAAFTVTNFALGNAFTHTYITPEVGVNVFYENWVLFRLGYQGDIGDGINSHQLILKFDYLF